MSHKRSRAVEIVQITDIHLGKDAAFMLKGVNTADTLSGVLAKVRQTSFDWLIATGDISDDFSPASYQLFRDLLRQADLTSLVCLSGNHDNPAVMESVLHSVMLPRVFDEGEWLFICLNTTIVGEDDGEIAEADFIQLETLLAQQSTKHVALFMHHHVISVQSRWIDRYGLRNADRFLALLDRHRHVRAVIGGHVHQTSESQHNGVTFYTTPATSLQFVPHSDKAEVSVDAPGWRKWSFWPDGQITTELYSL